MWSRRARLGGGRRRRCLSRAASSSRVGVSTPSSAARTIYIPTGVRYTVPWTTVLPYFWQGNDGRLTRRPRLLCFFYLLGRNLIASSASSKCSNLRTLLCHACTRPVPRAARKLQMSRTRDVAQDSTGYRGYHRVSQGFERPRRSSPLKLPFLVRVLPFLVRLWPFLAIYL